MITVSIQTHETTPPLPSGEVLRRGRVALRCTSPRGSITGTLRRTARLRVLRQTYKLVISRDTPQYQTNALRCHEFHPLRLMRRIARRKVERPVDSSRLSVTIVHHIVHMACNTVRHFFGPSDAQTKLVPFAMISFGVQFVASRCCLTMLSYVQPRETVLVVVQQSWAEARAYHFSPHDFLPI